MAFSTTLIIGLGGVGSKVVEGIYRKFNATNPTEIDRRNVAFLCMDTDENDCKQRKKVMPEGSVVKTSSDQSCTIGGYIDQIKGKTSVLDWFDTRSLELISMPLNEGAAQVRMASRLAAISAINENKFMAIDNSIKKLLTTEPERHAGNNIKIHIICSLAGGTGAGSFLQTAYYVKNAMKSFNASAPKITGYFILADVLCTDSSIGLSDDHGGIMVLDDSIPAGTPFVSLGMYDVCFELNVTPNRPDALSHRGVARELAAKFNRPLKPLAYTLNEDAEAASSAISLEVVPGCGCSRYVGRVIKDVKVEKSPAWLAKLCSTALTWTSSTATRSRSAAPPRAKRLKPSTTPLTNCWKATS